MIDRARGSLARGVLILDAAMGTRLIARGLDLSRDDPALWNLSHPEVVAAIHARDVAAGADAVLTNTFGANRVWLDRFGRAGDTEAINRQAVALARRAAGPDRMIFGVIGPTASDHPEAVREQSEILFDAGADAILFETHRADQAEAALRAVGAIRWGPVMVSLVAWPEPLEEIARRLAGLGARALGANCQPGMAAAVDLAERLRRVTGLPLIVKPGAGLPGSAPESPESFARGVARLRSLRPVFLGGCCGTTEAHVAALRAAWYHADPDAADSPRPDSGEHP